MSYKNADSATWQSIASQFSLILKGVGKSVFNGRSTFFWRDRWMDNYKLQDASLTDLSDTELSKSVADYWDGFGWKWREFQQKLPTHFLLRIATKLVQPQITIGDCYTWKPSLRGDFTVRSAYWIQFPQSQQQSRSLALTWKHLWKLQITERQRCFGWLLIHGRFLTKSLLLRRGLSMDNRCTFYVTTEESPIHLFCDCGESTNLRLGLLPIELK